MSGAVSKGSYWEKLPDGRPEQALPSKALYTKAEALKEAERCLYCSDAPCIISCPTSIDVPRFIKQIASGDNRSSAKTIFASNMLGRSCATACPVEELCVGSCVYNDLNGAPIAIGRLQHYATHEALVDEKSTGRKLFSAKAKTGKKVALIGAGPASLACAAHLALEGVTATLFEKDQLPGGLNTTGIAPYKFQADESLAEVDWLLGHGVQLKLGVEIGKDVTGEQLLADYDAVFVGAGLGKDRLLDLPGEDAKGVFRATELIAQLKNSESQAVVESLTNVLVVGGGNTAIDIARQLAKLGVKQVAMVYRGSEERMSGYKHEMKAARTEGVQLFENESPVEVMVNNGSVIGLKTKNSVSGDEILHSADGVVFAVGQLKHSFLQSLFSGVEFDDKGRVIVDEQTKQTGNEKVYAGGDCVNGGAEVVNAAAEGRDAAFAMIRKFQGKRGN